MESKRVPAQNIDEYIAQFPKEVQHILEKVRMTIKKAAPEAEEKISYTIPAFIFNGKPIAYFAGYKKHIGFYPAPRQADAFKNELSDYKGGKGTVQFPLDKPVPLNLITRMVKFRIKQSRAQK